MRRRTFPFGLLALAACARAVAAASAPRRIAALDFYDPMTRGSQWKVFRERLAELGHAEGRVLIDVRWASSRTELIPKLVDEVLATRPDVVVATTTPVALAFMKATKSVPIVMTGQADPVATGLVPSLARPGGNVTGVAGALGDIAVKRLDILHELVRTGKRFALLAPADNQGVAQVFQRLQSTASAMGVTIQLVDAGDAAAIKRAFEQLAAQPVDGLLVGEVLRPHAKLLADLAVRHRIPAIYTGRPFAEAGGLVAYGSDGEAVYRRVAEYVHRILEGSRPGDLPVEQVSTFELIVNLRTAKAMGLAIPESLLVRADHRIE